MRFIENGPSIPDELLLARDEGRVVFFCGAGVSRAEANLPDFFGLVEQVMDSLGVVSDSPVRTVFNHAQKIEKATSVSGLISADRLFGLLEQEFQRTDIENAVAQKLKPTEPEKLSAHQSLIDLATTPTGLVRIVTTNFDRLFNCCNPNLKSWVPPTLPDPNRAKELDGIVYLHGRVTEDYSSAEDDGFILSSGEFGRAYLAQAWATDFFKSILRKYVVVFVGYTADDPPVHYLLEALSRSDANLEKIYAFQSGDFEEARSKWQHKGVEAIAYDGSNYHKSLWDSLKLWAERAKNIDGWYASILRKAVKGPREMQPYERGQVAHIVSSVEGIKRFQSFEPTLPPEWLLVFDKYCRYAVPSKRKGGVEFEDGPEIDPFDLYSIDSDPIPEKKSSEDFSVKRECPSSVWDAFEINTFDSHEIRPHQISILRGWKASEATVLCKRLQNLTYWLGKVSSHPLVFWWAVRQSELHSYVIENIQWHLDRGDFKELPEMDKAWRYFIEAKEGSFNELDRTWYNLTDRIQHEGWSRNTARQYLEYLKPKLKISHSYDQLPPSVNEEVSPRAICRFELHYPVPESSLNIDNKWLKPIVEGIRKHLEFAIEFEQELEGYRFWSLDTLTPDESETAYVDSDESSYVMRFTELFEQLIADDFQTAYKEYESWGEDPFGVFSLLKVWALRGNTFGDASLLEKIFINELSNEDFWAASHSRDIVLTLKSRWKDFSPYGLKKLEQRILDGPDRWDSNEEGYNSRKAWRILDRVQWLYDNDCNLTIDIENLKSELGAIVPDWKPERSLEEARAISTYGGMVRTETNYSELLNLPLGQVIAKASELRGSTDDFLIEAEPFKGLVDDYPKKAITCLNLAVKRNEAADWAWHIFLRAEGRQEDSPEFINLLVNRFISYPESFWLSLVRDITDWLKKISYKLFGYRRESYYLVLDRLISLVSKNSDLFFTSIKSVAGTPPDFVVEAINSPISPIIQSMLDDPCLKELKEGDSLPAEWLLRIQTLLEVGNRASLLAMVICNHKLNWFYHWAEKWTCDYLLKYANSEDELELDAFWSGFFWGATVPTSKLFRIIKEPLIKFASQGSCSRRGYGKVLAGVLLAGWGDENTKSSYISSTEFRELLVKADEELRCSVITQLRIWSLKNKEGNYWPNKLEPFLLNVWPKQITAKSPTTTMRLCELAFSSPGTFSRIGSIVLPLLVKVNSSQLSFPGIRKADEIIKDYPLEVLAILHQVLSDDSRNWPYNIKEIFDNLESANSDIRFDERLIELRRKWDSR